MKLIYSGKYDKIKGKSIFLAGCTARPGQSLFWRNDIVEIFEKLGYNDTLILPEPENGIWYPYDSVLEWENYYLKSSDVILFWIPRSIDDNIYGFTSNIEFGRYLDSGKIVYGRPVVSDQNKYLDYWYEKVYNLKPESNLDGLAAETLNRLYR